MKQQPKEKVELQIAPQHFINNWIHFLWSKGGAENFTNIEFRCKDGSVKAHSQIIKSKCPLIAKIIKEEMLRESENHLILVEDFTSEIVSKFIEILYTGEIAISSPEQFEEIKEFGFKQLGFFMEINWNIFVETRQAEIAETPPEIIIIDEDEPDIFTASNSPILSNIPIHSKNLIHFKISNENVQNSEILKNDPLNLEDDLSNNPICSDISNKNVQEPQLKNDPLNIEDDLSSSTHETFDFITVKDERTPSNSDFMLQKNVVKQEKPFGQNINENKKEQKKSTIVKKFPIVDCLIQNKTTKSKSNPKLHTLNTHKESIRCKICRKIWPNNYALQEHLSCVHRGEKPFKCDQCPVRFGRKGHLNVHIKSVHLKLRPFQCEFCSKTYAFKFDRKIHHMVVHEK